MRYALVAALLLATLTAVLAGDVVVKVTVDGKAQDYNPPARMRGGTVYVPLRQGAQSLGLSVKWHAASKVAQVCRANGCALIKQSEGIMVSGSLFLPLRKMAEITGAKVEWNAAAETVKIQRPL
jgi:hypothetical protein